MPLQPVRSGLALPSRAAVLPRRVDWTDEGTARQARGLKHRARHASPLARRPYDLRHAGVSLALNAGVSATEVARRAGHSVVVLLKIYAHCIDGQADAANKRITDALGGDDSPDDQGQDDQASLRYVSEHSHCPRSGTCQLRRPWTAAGQPRFSVPAANRCPRQRHPRDLLPPL
jgi:hypothetical protein